MEELSNYSQIDIESFKSHYYAFVLIRMMQAMGAFGFRGFYEKKAHFLQSIPYALRDLKEVLQHLDFSIELPELLCALERVCDSEFLKTVGDRKEDKLNVSVQSFSYRRGIQPNGFVFDCRIIDDPVGDIRFEESHMNSEFLPTFFKEETSMHAFLKAFCAVVDIAIEKSIKQNNKQLEIYFGCVGGQHRSVYAAEYMAEYIDMKYDVEVNLRHQELDKVEA